MYPSGNSPATAGLWESQSGVFQAIVRAIVFNDGDSNTLARDKSSIPQSNLGNEVT